MVEDGRLITPEEVWIEARAKDEAVKEWCDARGKDPMVDATASLQTGAQINSPNHPDKRASVK
jgi:hypothetical protein